MTLKELSQLYYLNREIERDKERLDELYTKATSAVRTITDIPCAPGAADKTANYAAEIADLEGIIDSNVKRCICERNRLERYICGIADSRLRMIFSLRFVNGLSWEQVAAHIGGGNTGKGVSQACYRHVDKAD